MYDLWGRIYIYVWSLILIHVCLMPHLYDWYIYESDSWSWFMHVYIYDEYMYDGANLSPTGADQQTSRFFEHDVTLSKFWLSVTLWNCLSSINQFLEIYTIKKAKTLQSSKGKRPLQSSGVRVQLVAASIEPTILLRQTPFLVAQSLLRLWI